MPFIKCTRDSLLKPLQIVGGIVEGRQSMAILSNILVEKMNEKVTFTATDLEIQTQVTADVGEGEGEVKTTLPAAKLTALLNAITGSGTEVTLEDEGRHVVLRSGNDARFSLAPLAADGYPKLTAGTMDAEITVPASVLKHIIQMVHFAMAQQDVRYYLNGLLFVIDGATVRSVATDGHRLACCESALETESPVKVEAILPRKTVMQLMKMLPDYNRVIPTANDKKFLINREALIGALRRAAILTNEKFKGLRWVVSNGKLHIQSANSEMEEAAEDIAIDYDGEELDLGFNVTYLLDVLGNLRNTEVCFAFANSQGATLLTMPESDQFRYVLMPMRI